jgi:hypothetical protein
MSCQKTPNKIKKTDTDVSIYLFSQRRARFPHLPDPPAPSYKKLKKKNNLYYRVVEFTAHLLDAR